MSHMSKGRLSQISLTGRRKSRLSHVSIAGNLSIISQQPEPPEPVFLSEDYIILRGEHYDNLLDGEEKLEPPPSTPRGGFIFGNELKTIPGKKFDIKKLKIPQVRVLGIRKCIEKLGEFFDCNYYSTNLIQFWFLDIITDCIWRCQDEYLLTENCQKTVLEWVLYIFDIIRDPSLNFSRRRVFSIFHEAVTIAEDRIEAGNYDLVEPHELFHLKTESEEENLSDSDVSSLSFNDSDSVGSYLIITSEENPENPDFYKLPTKDCKCDISVTSSIQTITEKSIHSEEHEIGNNLTEEEPHYNSEVEECPSMSEFYQNKNEIHSRFLEDDYEPPPEKDPSINDNSSDFEYEWLNEIEKLPPKPIEKPKSIVTLASTDLSISSALKKIKTSGSKLKAKERRSLNLEERSSQSLSMKKQKIKTSTQNQKKKSDEETMKAWHEYNLWRLKMRDMSDPTKGWVPPQILENMDDPQQVNYTQEDFDDWEYFQIKNEWLFYLDKHKTTIDETNQKKFINYSLLLIIKQFVFEYFYESFQFRLIKMAFQRAPNLILEKLNDTTLPIPKICRDEFKRPAEKKPKPPKPVKEKKPKGKDKKKDKADKKAKSSSSKSSEKKDKKSKTKPEKPPKLTKEEKAEIERLKQEEQKKIEEQIIEEENKRLIFPLKLAVNEDFFKNIFGDYVEESEDKPKGKKKKK